MEAVVIVASHTPLNDGQTLVQFYADHRDGRNRLWAKTAPMIALNVNMKNELTEGFPIGGRFHLTFRQEETDDPDS